MLLLRYHRRLRMISEALELCAKGERVCHFWRMCLVSHGYGGFGGSRDGGDGWYVCGTKPRGLSPVGRCRIIFRVRCHTLMTSDLIAVLVRYSGRVETELVGLPGRHITGRHFVHAAGWLHSRVLYGRSCCC